MNTNEIRAKTYEVLSETMKEPDAEFADDVRSGRLYEFLVDAFEQLEVEHNLDGLPFGERAIAYEALKDQYESLFNDPFRHLVPVESVYGPERCFMGAAAREMATLYEAAGVKTPPEFAVMPDHLCLLLEFMALLCRESASEVQREFLDKHLGWLEKLRDDSSQKQGSPFYRAAIDAIVAFVQHERDNLNLAVGQERVGLGRGYRAGNRGNGTSPMTFCGGEL